MTIHRGGFAGGTRRVQTMRPDARVLGLAALVILAVCMTVVSGTADATFHGRNGLIAVSYTVNANEGPTAPEWGVLTINSSGHGRQQLRRCDTFSACAQWADVSYSPQGHQLAWDISTRHGWYVIIAHADGTHAVSIAAGFDPSFAPSGQRLLYVRRHGHGDQIVLRDLRRATTRVLLSIPSASHPQMSPDGRQIVFVHAREIWLMNADGTNPEPIIVDAGAPSWSPTGTELAYIDEKSARVYTALADGAGPRELPLPAKQMCYPPACGGGSTFAVFSPDGRQIAFDDPDASGDPTVFVVAAAGGRPRQLTSVYTDDAGGSVDGLSWQPAS